MSSRGLPLLLAGPQDDFVFLLGRLQTATLPEGVLTEIMSHLSPRDVLACRLVNKAWSRAAAAAVRHLDLPCKALAAAATAGASSRDGRSRGGGGGGSGEGVDAALRRLHRVWPAAEAVTLSALATGQALSAELSLQLLSNHLSRWRNLRELTLRDMPVTPAPLPPPCRPGGPRPAPEQAAVAAAAASRYGRAQSPGRSAAPSTGARAAAEAGRVGWRHGGGDAGGGAAFPGSSGGGGGGGGGPGPWGLGCLSCCLGLVRLDLQLVPAREPQQQQQQEEHHHHNHVRSFEHSNAQQHPAGLQQLRCRRRSPADPARLAAGQAALLEGLTRLARLTHLSVRLLDLDLDLPVMATGQPTAMGAGPAEDVRSDEGEGSDDGVVSDAEAVAAAVAAFGCLEADRGRVAATAAAAPAAAASAEEYLLDVEEAGSYEADLDMDLDLGFGCDPEDAARDGGSAGMSWRDGALLCQGEAAGAGSGGGSGGAAAVTPEPPRNECAARGSHPANGQHQQRMECPGEDQCSSASSDVSGYSEFAGRGSRAYDSDGDSSPRRRDAAAGAAGAAAVNAAGSALARQGPEAAAAAADVSRGAVHWVPQPALFARLSSRLRSLRLTGCDLRGGGAVAVLAGALTALTSLSLQGRLGVSHCDLEALSGLRDLRDLSLSRVELLYDARDPDDCPVALMSDMYGALRQLRHFQSLRFDLDPNGGTGIHSAYLLPLYESPLARLRALHLATVFLDSDYSFHMLAELTCLTCLTMSYVTWPLALQQDDMTLLAPLSGLRRFSMQCEPSERHHLISLSGRVVGVLAEAWPHLSQLAFTGQILPDLPGAPSFASLATWTSLRDLSLSAAPDDDNPTLTDRHLTHLHRSKAPAGSGRNADNDGSGRGGGDHGGVSYGGADDEDGAAAAAAAGALDLGVALGACLPPGLTRLALSGLWLRGGELLRLLAGQLTGLTSLQVLECGLTPAHLMVGDTGATQLQVLVLSDSRAWRACQSPNNNDGCRHSRCGRCSSCRCCCAPGISAAPRCLAGAEAPLHGGSTSRYMQSAEGVAAAPSASPPGAAGRRRAGHQREEGEPRRPRRAARGAGAARGKVQDGSDDGWGSDCERDGSEGSGRYGGAAQPGRDGGGGGYGWDTGSDTGGSTGSGWEPEPGRAVIGEDSSSAKAAASADAGAGVSSGFCGCWRRRLVRHSLATLGSLRCLEVLLLGLPNDGLAATDVLEPLAALTRLRCLTLRASGMRAATAWEVSEPLDRLVQLRSLHLSGSVASSPAALGVEDAARGLPYI